MACPSGCMARAPNPTRADWRKPPWQRLVSHSHAVVLGHARRSWWRTRCMTAGPSVALCGGGVSNPRFPRSRAETASALDMDVRSAPARAIASAGKSRVATYNTPIQTNSSYPIIGLSGLLNLVAVVAKFRPQAKQEKGSICQPPSSPPAPRAQRAHPVVDAAACCESPTPPVAAQSAAGASAKRRSRAGGGPR
jgi:hypothetical protein